jgi:excisionase family DNA binding protein
MTGENLWDRGACKVGDLKTRFGISRSHAYELMQAGELSFSKVGRNRLVPIAQVVELLNRGLVGAGCGIPARMAGSA